MSINPDYESIKQELLKIYMEKSGRIMFHKFKHNISSDLNIDQKLLEQLHNSLVQEGFLKRLRTLPHVWILTSEGRERIQDNYQRVLSEEAEESTKVLETDTIQALEAYYEERKSENKRRSFFNKQLMLYEFENLRYSPHKYAEFYRNHSPEILELLSSVTKSYKANREDYYTVLQEVLEKIHAEETEQKDVYQVAGNEVLIKIGSLNHENKFFTGLNPLIVDQFREENRDLFLLFILSTPNFYILIPPKAFQNIFSEETSSNIKHWIGHRYMFRVNLPDSELKLKLDISGGNVDVTKFCNVPIIESLNILTNIDNKKAISILYQVGRLNPLSQKLFVTESELEDLTEDAEEELFEEEIEDGEEDVLEIGEPDEFIEKTIELQLPAGLENRIMAISEKIAIKKEILRQIAIQLVLGKNIILYGPPGCGKTLLAKEIPQLFFANDDELIDTTDYYEMVTATADWTTYDVIGGLIKYRDSFKPYDGCVTRAIRKCLTSSHKNKGHWLVVDEFNRADIDKAFGTMFTAIEYGKLEHPFGNVSKEEESNVEIINIPAHFRIICTMNSFDKNHLFPISYGLLRRFALIEVPIPPFEEEIRIINSNLAEIIQHFSISETPQELIKTKDLIFDIFKEIRGEKIDFQLGTSHLLDVLNYYTAMAGTTHDWNQEHLESGIIIHLIPQFEGLQNETLNLISDLFLEKNLVKASERVKNLTRYRLQL